jgi:hypothetical protein
VSSPAPLAGKDPGLVERGEAVGDNDVDLRVSEAVAKQQPAKQSGANSPIGLAGEVANFSLGSATSRAGECLGVGGGR